MTAHTHDRILRRERLLARLDDPSSRVVVLVAPSGYGKTTLVRSWVASLDPARHRVLWVAMTGEVGTAQQLWLRVTAAAQRFGVAADVAPALARLAGDADPVDVVGDLVDGSDLPVVLVIDAYEHAGPVVAHVDRDLLRLVEHRPRLRVVVATRGGTTLVDPAAHGDHPVEVLLDDDLSFSADETAALVAGGRRASVIHDETGGYPLAVRALMLQDDGPPTIRPGDWRETVGQVLLDGLPPTLRELVAVTSVPPYLDLGLAHELAALVGVTDDARVRDAIRDLERHGLGRWIPYGEHERVFQYVDRVREAVRASASRHSAHHAAAAALAARWLRDQGEDQAAIGVAVDGARYDLAAEVFGGMLLRNPASYLSDALERDLSRIPDEELPRYPMLAFARGLGCLTSVATRAAAAGFFRIVAETATADLDGLRGTEVVARHVVQVVSLRHLDRHVEAAAVARRALGHYGAMGSDDHLVEFVPASMRHLAYSLFQGGDPATAIEVVDRAVDAARHGWSRNYTLAYAVGLNAFVGDRRQAEEAAVRVDPGAWPPGHEFTYVNALGRIGAATLWLDDLDFRSALAEYDGCVFLVNAEFWPFVTWTQMHARLGLGEAAAEALRVDEMLRRHPRPTGIGANVGTAALRNVLAISHLAAGRDARARAVLAAPGDWPAQLAPARLLALLLDDPARALAEVPVSTAAAGHTRRTRMAVATLAAAAALRADRPDRAAAHLVEAVEADAGHGVRAHLVYVPDDDLTALRDLAGLLDRPALAAYLAGDAMAVPFHRPLDGPLTERERVILAAMVDHPTRGGIATALFVSENTVKTQIRSIYRKLGVSTREAAIERAIELDLIGR